MGAGCGRLAAELRRALSDPNGAIGQADATGGCSLHLAAGPRWGGPAAPDRHAQEQGHVAQRVPEPRHRAGHQRGCGDSVVLRQGAQPLRLHALQRGKRCVLSVCVRHLAAATGRLSVSSEQWEIVEGRRMHALQGPRTAGRMWEAAGAPDQQQRLLDTLRPRRARAGSQPRAPRGRRPPWRSAPSLARTCSRPFSRRWACGSTWPSARAPCCWRARPSRRPSSPSHSRICSTAQCSRHGTGSVQAATGVCPDGSSGPAWSRMGAARQGRVMHRRDQCCDFTERCSMRRRALVLL